ncbi:MAG TPA: hypothetical protein VGR78_11915 [Verrucomicrobiae bacterium]|jgi:hypothetical protein|nr:hypothetical protein [Verrucomicrobiae bacterium]
MNEVKRKWAVSLVVVLVFGYLIGFYDGSGGWRVPTGLLAFLLCVLILALPKLAALLLFQARVLWRRRPPGGGSDDPPTVWVPRPPGGRPPVLFAKQGYAVK